MKKTFLLPILLLGLTLASCGSSKAGTKGEFKDLKYGEALLEDEAQEVAYKAFVNANQVSSATVEEVEYEEGDNTKAESKEKTEVKISSEGYLRATVKAESSQTVQGLTWKEKHEVVEQMAFATKKIEDVDVYARMIYESVDGIEKMESTLVAKAAVDDAAEHMSMNTVGGFFAGLINAQNMQVFKVKKGFEAVVSSIDESHTAVDWDQGYKEYVQITKMQTKYVINDKYQVTEMTSDLEYHTNRDAQTGAWYDKVIVAEKTTVSAKAKYDAKVSDAALSSDLVSKGANSMLVADPAVLILLVKVDGETVTPVNMLIPDLDYAVRTGITSARVGFRVNLAQTAEYNGFAFVAGGSVQKDVFTASSGLTAAFAPAIEGTSQKSFTYGDVDLTAIVFPEEMPARTGLITLEVASSPDALTASNVAYQAY